MELYNIYTLLLRESISGGVFKDRTSIPYYDMLLMGRYDELPSEYSNMRANIEYMSPMEYLMKCAEIQNTTYEDQLSYIRKSKVDELINLIDNGVKLDMPYLNYVKGQTSQEGRHRAKAAMEYGVGRIPVLVITRDEDDDNSGENYIRYDLRNIKNEMSLLRRLDDNFESYMFDEILNIIKFRNLYPTPLAYVNQLPEIAFYDLKNMILDNINEFIDLLPNEYMDMDEDKLSLLLAKLGMLFVLERNLYIFKNVFDYDIDTQIGVLNVKEFDVDDYYNIEDDIFKMDKDFIRRRINELK